MEGEHGRETPSGTLKRQVQRSCFPIENTYFLWFLREEEELGWL